VRLDFSIRRAPSSALKSRVGGMPTGVARRWDQIDRGASFTLGWMKTPKNEALHFELWPRWQSRELLFDYRAALVLGDADFL
jgi:hypothetical protein